MLHAMQITKIKSLKLVENLIFTMVIIGISCVYRPDDEYAGFSVNMHSMLYGPLISQLFSREGMCPNTS